MEYTIENFQKATCGDVFEFTCQHCGAVFTRSKRHITKNRGVLPKFCSPKCIHAHQNMGMIEVTCKECGKRKIIKKSEYNKSENGNFFCDRSCAASYNNRMHPKRQPTSLLGICPVCGGKKSHASEMCRNCRKNAKRNFVRSKKLGYYIGFDDRRQFLTHRCAEIRKDARDVLLESNVPCECAICHDPSLKPILEVHHIKGILAHTPDTMVSQINDIKNLAWLCPNHHRLVHLGLIKF